MMKTNETPEEKRLRMLIWRRAYRKKNIERYKEYERKGREKHREKNREYNREYNKKFGRMCRICKAKIREQEQSENLG
jgi:hypothetical protein